MGPQVLGPGRVLIIHQAGLEDNVDLGVQIEGRLDLVRQNCLAHFPAEEKCCSARDWGPRRRIVPT